MKKQLTATGMQPAVFLKKLIVITGNIAQNGLHGTIQNAAEIIDGFGGDILIMLQAVQGAVGQVVFTGQSIPVFFGLR